MTGGDTIAAILQAQGVRTAFSLAGASHTHLLDPLERSGCRIISSRHESGAVSGADGYARAMAGQAPERPGVALIVSEQGIANAVGGLAVAHALGTPVLVLAAIPPEGFVEPANVIASVQLEIVRPVCKWTKIVPSARELAETVRRAIELTVSGQPGPVVLFIPQDQLRHELPDIEPAPIVRAVPDMDTAAIGDAAKMLKSSSRPLAIAGIGAFRGNATGPLQQLAKLGVPVLGNGSGRGVVPEDGEHGWSWPFAQHRASEADCVIVVGEIMTQRLGFGLPPRFAPDAKFIEIGTSKEAFHRNRCSDVAIEGEPAGVLCALLESVDGARWSQDWLAEGMSSKRALIDRLAASSGHAIHPIAAGRALAPYIDRHTMLVGDGADIQNWMYSTVSVTRQGGFMDHFPLGAMGCGTPLAVGAAAAELELAEEEGRPATAVVLVTGDGAMGFYPSELHAACLAGLNLKVVVGNDQAWGTEAHGQREAIGRTINTELGDVSYSRLAQSFGCAGLSCCDIEQLPAAMERLFECNGPALLDIHIDPEAGALLKTNPLASSIVFNDLAEGRAVLAQSLEESD